MKKLIKAIIEYFFITKRECPKCLSKNVDWADEKGWDGHNNYCLDCKNHFRI